MTFGPKRECAQPLPSLLKLLETLRSVDRYTPAPQISPEVIRSVPEKFRRPLHKAAPAVACCAVHVLAAYVLNLSQSTAVASK